MEEEGESAEAPSSSTGGDEKGWKGCADLCWTLISALELMSL
jgi:hypothetical protein